MPRSRDKAGRPAGVADSDGVSLRFRLVCTGLLVALFWVLFTQGLDAMSSRKPSSVKTSTAILMRGKDIGTLRSDVNGIEATGKVFNIPGNKRAPSSTVLDSTIRPGTDTVNVSGQSVDVADCLPFAMTSGPHGTGRIGNQLYAVGKAVSIADAIGVSIEVYSHNKNARIHILNNSDENTRTKVCITTDRRFPVPVSPEQRTGLREHFTTHPGLGYACENVCACGIKSDVARGNRRSKSWGDRLSVQRFRHAMVVHVLPVLFTKPNPPTNPRTLVLHIRSGDVFVDGRGYKVKCPRRN